MEMIFTSAYHQLRPTEKVFVDTFVADMENKAVKAGVKLSQMLASPVAITDDPRCLDIIERPLVRAAIAERIKDISDAMELSAYRVLKELSNISFSNVQDFFKPGFANNELVFDISHCTREQLAAVQCVEVEENLRGNTRKYKIKLHDKIAAITMFMKHMGLMEADNPAWRAEKAKVIDVIGLPNTVSNGQAADAYSRLINC